MPTQQYDKGSLASTTDCVVCVQQGTEGVLALLMWQMRRLWHPK
jgi:hypothetical protein